VYLPRTIRPPGMQSHPPAAFQVPLQPGQFY